MPGQGMLAPTRYRQMIPSVKRTLLRRSGTRNMFARLVRVLRISDLLLPGLPGVGAAAQGPRDEATCDQSGLVGAEFRDGTCSSVRPTSAIGERVALCGRAAVGRTAAAAPRCARRRPRWPPRRMREKAWADTLSLTGQLAPAEHLDQAVLVDQARGPQGLGVDHVALEAFQGIEVDHVVFHPERVLEALQLRDALLERELAALEAGLDVVAGALGPWCRGRRSCRPCRRYRGRPAAGPWSNPGAGLRS